MKPLVSIPMDVHLMIAPADPHLEAFREAGADIISVHPESGPHLNRTLKRIRDLGAKAGVVFNPSTPVETIEWMLEDIDLVLVMSVNPGFGGQSFMASQLGKVTRLRQMIDRAGVNILVEGRWRRHRQDGAAVPGCGRRRAGRGDRRVSGGRRPLRGQYRRPEGRCGDLGMTDVWATGRATLSASS